MSALGMQHQSPYTEEMMLDSAWILAHCAVLRWLLHPSLTLKNTKSHHFQRGKSATKVISLVPNILKCSKHKTYIALELNQEQQGAEEKK